MNRIPDINIDDYYYDLPEEKIAQYPVRIRDRSKLLIYNKGVITDDLFSDIHHYLPADSTLIMNDTKVIRARILFRKETGAGIEVFCLEPLSPPDYQQAFSSYSPVEWKCIIGNLKKWKEGSISIPLKKGNNVYTLTASKINMAGEAWRIRFSWDAKDLCFSEVIETAGHIPLPPYIKREDEKEDYTRYQTVYSKTEGSVAAPTAGLHFTQSLIEKINEKGISINYLTLHVGAGTFKPVRTNDLSLHEMHCEHFFFSRSLIRSLLNNKGKIIAVGTTSVRALESIYLIGLQIINNSKLVNGHFFIDQGEPFSIEKELPVQESLSAISDYMDKEGSVLLSAATKLMIVPGYKFQLVDGMITNFHMPGSTLLLLVSAWTGNDWKNIYRYAMDNDFRFLSYGDSSLLL